MPAKSKSRRNNIFDKLMLIIYKIKDSRHAQWRQWGEPIKARYPISSKLSFLSTIVGGQFTIKIKTKIRC